MPNTSASGGYLLPAAAPAPVEGDAFEDFLHDVIQGITGMDATLIRPRWQDEPPNMPQASNTWCAFGIASWIPDTYAIEELDPAGDGSVNLIRHETDELLASFYGPDAQRYASYLRDGLQVSQNRAALVAAGVGLVRTGNVVQVPSLVKERWQRRVDLPITVRRQILRNYPVMYLLTANAILYGEGAPLITTPIDVHQ
jgi:hypothetical protein